MARTWVLRHDERPWTYNALRSARHWSANAARTRRWRTAFAELAKAAGLPADAGPVEVVATPHLPDRRGQQDTAACVPAVKAAVDGLCDGAGWLTPHGTPDDGPGRFPRIVFLAPVYGDGAALVIELREVGP
jgi:hypothetical protein